MSTLLDALVPLASILLGAGITYWLNVRSRRRSWIEEIFNQAITAVAVADASAHYLRGFDKPPSLSPAQHAEMLANIEREAVEHHARRATEAREAVARVSQFDDRFRALYCDAEVIVKQPEMVIGRLIEGRNWWLRSNKRRRRIAAGAQVPS